MAAARDVAEAFAAGKSKKVGNAHTDGETYYLYGNPIATMTPNGAIYDWCGYYTITTCGHLNAIAMALRVSVRFSYAEARDFGLETGMFSTYAPIPAAVRKTHRALHATY